MLTLRGDTRGLEKLSRALNALARKQPARQLAMALQPELQTLSDRPWQRRATPDGAPWAARKRPVLHPILERTGRLRTSVRSRVVGSTIVTSVSPFYARMHQQGTRKMVARPFFPATALPAAWRVRLEKIARDRMREMFGG